MIAALKASTPTGLHLDLDHAWPEGAANLKTLDATEWGPRLRFSAPTRVIERFAAETLPQLPPFALYGSGDFHHLTALLLRRLSEPVVIVSFDNHPDWDVRPPRWGCGGWLNRALELPQVERVSVWGCGNFECWWPAQMFGNRRAERAGQIDLHIWADDRPLAKRNRRGAMFRTNWRELFSDFVRSLAGRNVYVTVDLDTLCATDAVTNWEPGKFTVDELVWALTELRGAARILGGDICGAYSPPKYARLPQRFVAEFDHPKLAKPSLDETRAINLRALAKLWPSLTERNEHDAGRDQE